MKGLFLSVIFHCFIFLFIFRVIPDFFAEKRKDVDVAVDIITLDQLIAARTPPPPPIIKPEIKELKKAEEKKIEDSEKLAELKEEIVKPVEPVKKVEVKKKVPKKPKKLVSKIPKSVAPKSKPATKKRREKVEIFDQDMADILDEVKRVQKSEEERVYREKYIYGTELNPYEKASIRKQINSCWSNIVGKLFSKEEILGIRIKVLVALDEEGNVVSAKLAESAEDYMELDNFLYRQVADSALSTFYRCDKIYNLPKDKYQHWQEFEFTFDPSEL